MENEQIEQVAAAREKLARCIKELAKHRDEEIPPARVVGVLNALVHELEHINDELGKAVT
jgi:hypothetical protein